MTLSEIKTSVCKAFGIEECDFVIAGRPNEFAFPRFAYYSLCKSIMNVGVVEISKTVLRKHSTVINGILRHNDLIVSNYDYSVRFKKAQKELKDKTKQQP